MGICENIRRLRNEAHLSQDEVAAALDVDRSTISQWETGWSRPRMGRITQIADYFGVSVSELVADCDRKNTVPLVPLVNLEYTGFDPILYKVEAEQEVEVPESVLSAHPSAFAVLVESGCMSRVIPTGAVAICDPDLKPTNGRIIIVKAEGQTTTLRRWYRHGRTLVLVADSYEDFDDIIFTGTLPVRSLGTVVWMQSAEEL